jgi:hypothetical protein
MGCRSLWLVGAVAGVGMLLPAAPASAAAKCSGKGAQGVASTSSARVFTLPAAGNERKLYACLFSQNKKRYLGWVQECHNDIAAREPRLAGPWVAYVEYTCDLVSGRDSVVVMNIKTGKRRFDVSAASGTEDENSEASTTVTDLELSSAGSVAWIGEFDADNGGGIGNSPNDNRFVGKADGAGIASVDSGTAIEPDSLALGRRNSKGNPFYWMKGGAAFGSLLN